MSFAVVRTRSSIGIHAQSVAVEVYISQGLPGFTIVGLAETAVKESKDRVRSAILNSQFDFPFRKIIVNLAPADLPKTGSGFDLPIAIGILVASAQIPKESIANIEFIGELALNGNLRRVFPIIPAVISSFKEGQKLIIPLANAEEASLVGHNKIQAADSLCEVCDHFCQNTPLRELPQAPQLQRQDESLDWGDVKGQEHAKLALEIAAYGGHSVLLNGPPGSGKTMLAKRFSTLLPNLNDDKALECAAIASLKGRFVNYKYWKQPPFRAPHHTASPVALVGGGNPPKPGEISLAHNGVLFLDELPEFQRNVLETLREPLESGVICISRASNQIEFPASFQLIAAMNPCPCGQKGNSNRDCICAPQRILRYQEKLSGPLMDRIDLHITVAPLKEEEMLNQKPNAIKISAEIRSKVAKVRELQLNRQQCLNANIAANDVESRCNLSKTEHEFLQEVLKKLKPSARSFHRLLKVARTIADMESSEATKVIHLKKALAYKYISSS